MFTLPAYLVLIFELTVKTFNAGQNIDNYDYFDYISSFQGMDYVQSPN